MKSCASLPLAAAIAFSGLVPGDARSSSSGRIALSGVWTLDTYVSDHPAQVAAAIRIDLGQGVNEPVQTTKQLLVRVEFERSPGQPGPIEVKQMYSRAPAR